VLGSILLAPWGNKSSEMLVFVRPSDFFLVQSLCFSHSSVFSLPSCLFHSEMTTATSLPEINYPTRVDARHQGPKATVAAALCLCIAGTILATRMLIRWPWRRLLGLDDGAVIVASVRNLEMLRFDKRKDTDCDRSSLLWVNG
jgi:hypothetical protein